MPTWEEMAEIKRMFFKPEEACFELHPPEDEYVNLHNFCLHIWRPQHEAMPLPPSWMVEAATKAWEDEVFAAEPV